MIKIKADVVVCVFEGDRGSDIVFQRLAGWRNAMRSGGMKRSFGMDLMCKVHLSALILLQLTLKPRLEWGRARGWDQAGRVVVAIMMLGQGQSSSARGGPWGTGPSSHGTRRSHQMPDEYGSSSYNDCPPRGSFAYV